MKLKVFAITPFVLMFACLSTSALANDQIISTVTNSASGPQAIIVNNGVPSGTIQLWYTYVGSAFPCGQFATFNLALQDNAGSRGTAPTYPVELDLAQTGNGTPVQFLPPPDPASFQVTAGSLNYSVVAVTINCANLPAGAPYDGEDIVGNLNQSTNPPGSHLDTISTIQVHIKLSIPSASACLKLYSFETDQTGNLLDSMGVTVHSGNVKSTQPGTISVDGLAVNTCPDSQSFDLDIALDPKWDTQPSNGHGISTFAYALSGEVDPATYDFTTLTGGTSQVENLCIPNVTLESGQSYLVTVHSAANTPFAPPASGTFNFGASLSTAGSSCSSSAYLPHSLVSPANPAASVVSFTVTNN
jgi:hypothetical protein